MSSLVYSSLAIGLPVGQIKVSTSTFKMMLVDALYVPDRNLHTRRIDVTNEIGDVGGYVTGGLTVSSSSTYDSTSERLSIRFNGFSISNSTISAAAGVIYQVEGSAAADILICYVDFAGIRVTSNSTFTVSPSYVYLQF